jgi:tape measure domain-containing protein
MAQTLYINVKGDTKDLVNDLKKAENVTVKAGKKMSTGLNAATKGVDLLKGAVVAYLGVHTVKKLVEISDTYTSLESRLKLVTSSTSELTTTQAALLKVANDSRVNYESTVTLFARLSRASSELGISQGDVLKATEAMSKGLIVAGATTEEAYSATLQFSQGMAKGRLDGEELRAVMESMPDVMKKVAKSMGIAWGDLKEYGKQGMLTTDKVLPALIDILGEVRGEFDQMDVTVGQATTVLKNSFFDIINEANKTSGATSSISDAILDLAKIIRENKTSIVEIFSESIELAGDLLEVAVNIKNSIAGWKAVGDGSLDFLDFATMNAEELAKWMDEDAVKIRELTAEQETLSSQLKKDWAEQRKWFGEKDLLSKEEKENIKERISEIKQEKKSIENLAKVIAENYTDSWMTASKAAKKTGKDTEEVIEGQEKDVKAYNKAVKKVQDSIEKANKKTFRKLSFFSSNYTKEQISNLTEIDNEWLGINDEIEKDTEKTLKAMGVDIKFYTDEQKDELTDMADEWMGINADIEAADKESKTKLKENWEDFADDSKSAMDTFVDDIIEDGESLSDAWDTLWRGMASSLVSTLADMAATYAASTIARLWTTSGSASLFHTGLWNNLRPGETAAILEEKEMVVPSVYAEQIRNNLGENTGFAQLADATNPGSWETSTTTGSNLQSLLEDTLETSILEIGTALLDNRSMSVGTAIRGVGLTGILNLMSGAMDEGFETANLGRESSLLGPSSYSRLGGSAFSLANAVALAGNPVAATVTEPMANTLGGFVGDLIGDALDDREFESLRDMVEDETMTPTEALSRMHSAQAHPELSGYSGTSNLGAFAGWFEDAWDSVTGFFDDPSDDGGGTTSEGFGDRESQPGGMGGVHGGMDFIPKETTYMLDRGERVLSPRQNQDLTSFLRSSGDSGEMSEYRRDMYRFVENISLLMDKFDRLGISERV